MSWDAELRCDSCGHSERDWNYTYNTTPMVRAAAEAAGVEFDGFQKTLDGMSGPEGQRLLRAVIREMEDHPAKYRAMNPPNGWGSYDGILVVMREMADAVGENPATWVVT